MKKSAIISIVLIVLVVFAWMIQLSDISNGNSTYRNSVTQAEKYQEQKLYQKAILQYEEALLLKENMELREQWIEAYRLGYDDGVFTAKEYGNALTTMYTLYPDQVKYWERTLEFYLETGNYSAAYETLRPLERAAIHSDKLTELEDDVRYSYRSARRNYYQVYSSTYGTFTLYDGEKWGVMGVDGEMIYECEYMLISPVNVEGIAVYQSEKDTRLINQEKVVDAIIAANAQNVRAPAQYILPVQDENGTWRYFDCTSGQYMSGSYDDASSFVNGIAAVKTGRTWKLITVEGDSASEATFTDVKLHDNGEYAYRKVLIAAQNGDYAVYNAKGELHCNIPGTDADVYLGGYIAYKDTNGKWGYMDMNGNVVITPQFADARSFSNGLAAVHNGSAWGYINPTGTIVIDCQYKYAGYFSSKGVAFVSSVEDEFFKISLRFGG